MYSLIFISFWLFAWLELASATPIVKSLNPSFLKVRSPLTDEAFASDTDWPTNVVMVGASQTYGMWVPMDAYAEGPCNGVTIDQIGVVAGDGPCTFKGNDGYVETVPGVAGDGYYTVAPPQNIMFATCG
ncbi:hypothetical protein LTR99_002007 [Exophiala xenobiotica]|nr:hypothetical protein LTR92_004425 [Exophiala xenobiotica]KAK5226215.1 hypothetical protein LTR72_004119 [Exophiala xenobiotica]KAK5272615.1 hypothetical protein LTR96_002246 [Exophiala xenobiotica]KAK5292156.1 hypothetical protein LTR14_005706 [Exophiala xenobiotica]KAK5306316.1 hypothetical protein LTR99_002007 [Exophiala xenobiotica]